MSTDVSSVLSAATRHELALPSGERIVFDWIAPAPVASASTAPVAVFVHGLGSHRRGDKALHFAERFAAMGWGWLALDLRGHGESGSTMEQLSLTRCVEDMAAVLSWLPAQANPRLMIGSSMGGAVVAWHHVLHRRAGTLLAFIAPSLRFPSHYTELPAAELAEWQRTGVRRFASEWIDLRIGYGLVADSAQYPFVRLLAELDAPTLILHGTQDSAVPWRQSLDFLERATNPDVDLVLIKRGDHRLTEQKAYLFDVIADWVRRHPAI
jgi:predicted alpha/beta-fold hydrolase